MSSRTYDSIFKVLLPGLVAALVSGHASAGSSQVDATNVQMATGFAPSYCSSIDGVDYSSQQYFTSASDVTAKTGQTVISQNGGSCCTAAKPWNGSSCATLVCPAGTENVAGTCKPTANACAAIGLVLIGGSCQTATPPYPFDPGLLVGKFHDCTGGGYWVRVDSPTQLSFRAGPYNPYAPFPDPYMVKQIYFDSQSFYFIQAMSNRMVRMYPDQAIEPISGTSRKWNRFSAFSCGVFY